MVACDGWCHVVLFIRGLVEDLMCESAWYLRIHLTVSNQIYRT